MVMPQLNCGMEQRLKTARPIERAVRFTVYRPLSTVN
jgi:hypothetical protein